jgi:hypothetical protein
MLSPLSPTPLESITKHEINMKKVIIISILSIVAASSLNVARGQLSFTAQVGGTPSVAGASLETFNEASPSILSLSGNAFLATGSGHNGQGLWFPPYYSGATASYFGDSPANGYDASQYVAVQAGGSATMTFPQPEQYFGLLIGSVDAGNTLSFYFYGDGDQLIGSITGSEIPHGTGDGGIGQDSTEYLNVTSSTPFNSVVATYNGASFEFDDLAYASSNVPNPEPPSTPIPEQSSTAILGGLAAVSLFLCGFRVQGSGAI